MAQKSAPTIGEASLEEIVRALAAACEGDFSVRLPARRRDVVGELQGRVNELVGQNRRMAKELARVARVIGRDGRMTERAVLPGLYGEWADSIESVNALIDDLVRPTTEVARVITAVAAGDLSQKMALTIEGQPVRGEFHRIGTTVNAMVDQLSSFADETTRVAREVGTEGKLGGQARVKGVSGTWRDLTDSVNVMASNLTDQVRQIAAVTTAVAEGDLSQKVTVEAKGEVAALARTINAMVDRLSSFADEVTRVAREVGTEGELGGQAQVDDVSGTWRDLTDSVNVMASNLTDQVRQIASVTKAVAGGDLAQKVTVEAKGEVAALAETINSMTDTLRLFAEQVTGVAREVGTEGRLGGQAEVPDAAGTWRDLTDSVNLMASNLTDQVRQIAAVTTAVAEGDLSQKVTVEAKGEVAALAETINSMTDTLRLFAEQVTGVAREVGTLGVLGGQADVPGVSGTWRDLTENVNFMAANLTDQVRNIAQVTTAVANGDLSQQITVDAQGEILELKKTINTMVDQLSSFADEVTRVAREVGTEGKLGGQAEVQGVSGTWRDLTENVNFMAANLTSQVRNIAHVATAVATGDLSQQITVDAQGEILELKSTLNTMVDQLGSFADEVTRVAREVGTDGKLGGQARVEGVSGTWRDLTDSVNSMAANLTDQVRNIAQVTTAVANGDLSQQITVDARGEIQELKNTINTMVDQLSSFADEVTRVAREVGTEGKLGGQAEVEGVSGTWRDLTENVNFMASNLTDQVRSIAQVTTAVAKGDLTQQIDVDARGEIQELKNTINTMVDQLGSFADEVTRVATEVGTEGKLGGQAEVKGVSGTWRDLTESVNELANNLTGQVRNIAQVTTAVANGDLTQQITVDARGEILELKKTINTMVDQLSSFADEVTRVAREVGTEGILGGQAEVEGVSGTWRGLTESVNQLASNLTTQVRAMADVATAVTEGDLTRQIAVEAQGEVAELKDRVNQMIANLRDTTKQNAEQDWLKTNLARISGALQGQRDLQAVSQLLMSEISPLVGAQHGAFFLAVHDEEAQPELRLVASYGRRRRKSNADRFAFGEGLPGQAAMEMKSILVTRAPAGYVKVTSGLGEAEPVNIMVLPILFEGQVLGVVELASLQPFAEVNLTFLEQLAETIGVVLSTIIANGRTEELLADQRRLTQELQSRSHELQTQQEELRQTNEELEEKATLLSAQNRDIEIKNAEIERGREALEERARQLALSSRYKSEFLANMSHELRTPLNSLLILSKLLTDNPHGNLNEEQVEFARTINSAGSDLLHLISDILDLSKVEAGKMDLDPATVEVGAVLDAAERSFRPVAEERGLAFQLELAQGAPVELFTDEQRLLQVLRNLLSNAMKFTDHGFVRLAVEPTAESDLDGRPYAVAFRITDSGIGIADDKLRLIFEAFQQADGTTSRRYGGTGLGLSISREIAHLLGGEIRAESTAGEGSTFSLLLPATFVASAPASEDGRTDLLEAPAGGHDHAHVTAHNGGFAEPAGVAVADDRSAIQHDDDVLLVAAPDPDAAVVALDQIRALGCKGIVAVGAATAQSLAAEHVPSGIVAYGPELLGRFKHDPRTRHVPVLAVGAEAERHEALVAGAVAFTAPDALQEGLVELREQLERRIKRLLVVEDDARERDAVARLIGGEDVEVTAVGSSEEAMIELDSAPFDCIVLDLKLPRSTGFQLLEHVRGSDDLRDVPVIIHTGKALTQRDEARLRRFAQTIVVKDARSPERLLAETSLHLHRRPAALAPEGRRMLANLEQAESALTGKRVLIVDDDVRNVFALASALEAHGMEVRFAENGREGLQSLQADPIVDLVLMDVMMPEMDGYQTMRAIREVPELAELPVIALTAKAMQGDRDKSIAAGASDYITKPVDMDQLIALMRVWLNRA
jgi:HAMP domain-containing protein/signal transduction histidine kinase/CheY-like chemotaxis protein